MSSIRKTIEVAKNHGRRSKQKGSPTTISIIIKGGSCVPRMAKVERAANTITPAGWRKQKRRDYDLESLNNAAAPFEVRQRGQEFWAWTIPI